MAYILTVEIRRTDEFDDWLKGLKDVQAKLRIVKRLQRVEDGNFGDHASVGDGVSELRLHHGPGYRVYYALRGEMLVVLLGGGIKDSQDRDIEKAKALAKEV